MKLKAQNLRFLFIIAMAFLGAGSHGQSAVSGNATDFTSAEYYPAPDQAQIKLRLSGAEAAPLPGGLLVIKQFKLELFSSNGVPQAVVDAPECLYDSTHGQANSAGQLFVRNGDGKIRMQGMGFMWRQADSFLIISNDVKTVIENNAVMLPPGKTAPKMP